MKGFEEYDGWTSSKNTKDEEYESTPNIQKSELIDLLLILVGWGFSKVNESLVRLS